MNPITFFARHWKFFVSLIGATYYGSGMLFYLITKGHAGIPIDQGWEPFSIACVGMGLSMKQNKHDEKINVLKEKVDDGSNCNP